MPPETAAAAPARYHAFPALARVRETIENSHDSKRRILLPFLFARPPESPCQWSRSYSSGWSVVPLAWEAGKRLGSSSSRGYCWCWSSGTLAGPLAWRSRGRGDIDGWLFRLGPPVAVDESGYILVEGSGKRANAGRFPGRVGEARGLSPGCDGRFRCDLEPGGFFPTLGEDIAKLEQVGEFTPAADAPFDFEGRGHGELALDLGGGTNEWREPDTGA